MNVLLGFCMAYKQEFAETDVNGEDFFVRLYTIYKLTCSLFGYNKTDIVENSLTCHLLCFMENHRYKI